MRFFDKLKNKQVKYKMLEEFLSTIDYDKLKKENLINIEDLSKYENELNMRMGIQLRKYILNYGYIGYEYIQFLGINNIKKEKSDMITDTKKLRKMNSMCDKYIVFENEDSHYFIVVDKDDNVYEVIEDGSFSIKSLNKKLYEFIIEKLRNI